MKTNAKQKIIKYLSKTNSAGKGKSLTTKQARELFNIVNVSARVSELRRDGFNIVSEKTKKGPVTVNAYRLKTK